MNERDETRLRDMLDAARRAFVHGKERDVLETDNYLVGFAGVRAIEIIGEAASKIASETRAAFPQIEWNNIIGMRNRIIHDYLRVDYDIVWKVLTDNLPQLIAELERILYSDSD